MQEFDFLEETYVPILEQEKLLSSKGYQTLKKNNIDTAELDGIEKESEAGTIEFKELSDEDNKIFLKDVTDFLFDIPRDTIISFIRGTTNASQFINNLTSAIGINPDDSYEFINERLDKTKAHLDSLQEDSPFVTKLMGIVAQDAAYTYPIYKKLQKLGVPKSWNVPISFGVGGALAFDKKETLFLDSTMVQGLKEMAGIDPDTLAGELYDKAYQAVEYGFGAKLAEKIIDGFKLATKIKNKKELAADVAVGTAGGAVLGKSIYDTLNPNEQVNFSEEKKTPELGDQSSIPGTVNEYGFEKTAGLLPIVKAAGKELVKSPIFKSNVVEAVKNIPNKGSGDQVLGQIKNIPGVKQSEIKWIGLDDFLKNKKSVTKQEVSEFVNSNRIDVSEVTFGGQMSKLSDDVEEARNVFERKWLKEEEFRAGKKLSAQEQDMLLDNNLNYDQVELFSPKDATYSTIPFGQFDSYFGDDLARGFIKPNKIFYGPEGQTFKITELELEKFATEKLVRVERRMGTAPKFGEHTEPGGEDYTELVFKIKKGGMDVGIPVQIRNAETTTIKNNPFRSPAHMDVSSEIAHVRFKTRDLNGLKVLTVEEMQSDFAIRATKENRVFGGEKPKIADFPFKNTWYELTVKRLIRYAADNGFDAVAIPKGSVAAKRYGQEIDKVKKLIIQKTKFDKAGFEGWKDLPEHELTVLYYDDAGKIVHEKNFPLNKEHLDKFKNEIGSKEFSKMKGLFETAYETNSQFVLDKPIVIGSGKGKAELYDQAIPGFMKKYAKKWNAKVYDDTINHKMDNYSNDDVVGEFMEMPVTILELTPEMKKAVQEGGQSLFEILGTLGASGVAAKAVSDSKGNNTISNQTNY